MPIFEGSWGHRSRVKNRHVILLLQLGLLCGNCTSVIEGQLDLVS